MGHHHGYEYQTKIIHQEGAEAERAGKHSVLTGDVKVCVRGKMTYR